MTTQAAQKHHALRHTLLPHILRPIPALIPALIALLAACPAQAAETASALGNTQSSAQGGALSYANDRTQVGIGVNTDGGVYGEIRHVLNESASHATLGEAWIGNNGLGLKVAYNWTPPAVSTPPGNTPDQQVNKLFAALDQNDHQDRKLTLGGGVETARGFLGGYLSRGLTGNRELASAQDVSTQQTSGVMPDGRPYLDTLTTTTTTRFFEHAYDWGVGARLGHFYENPLVLLTGGLDYEWGKSGAEQTTLSLEAEKFFAGSPLSLALRGELSSRDDSTIKQESDSRLWLMLKYSFGGPAYRAMLPTRGAQNTNINPLPATAAGPAALVAATPVAATRTTPATSLAGIPAAPAPASTPVTPPADTVTAPLAAAEAVYRNEKRIVKTTASMSSDAFFQFDSATLTPAARTELARVADILKTSGYQGNIRLAGHTCDLGDATYNLGLSRRRAEAVKAFLAKEGSLPADRLVTEGLGEQDPRYPNTRATRAKNRRVDMEFITYQDKEETYQVRVNPPSVATPAAAAPTAEQPAAPRIPRPSEPPRAKAAAVETPHIEWKNEVVEAEPAWVRAALRAAVPHKRTVDTYRTSIQSTETSSVREFVNRAPSAQADTFSISSLQPTALDVLANDTDLDADELSISAVTQPSSGSVSISGKRILFTPAASFPNATETFSYTVSDGKGGTATGIVVLNTRLNQAPLAMDDRFTVSGSSPSTLNVMANDSDPDNDTLSIVSLYQPAAGVATISNGQILFVPYNPFSYTVFTYTVSDGNGGTASATVTLVDP